MAEVYIQLAGRLLKLSGSATKESIIEALGYTPSSFSGEYADLLNAPAIIEDDSASFVIIDTKGNIIASFDGEGLHTTDVYSNGKKLEGFSKKYSELLDAPAIMDDASDSFSIIDSKGNIIATFDKDGLHTTDVYSNGKKIEGGTEGVNDYKNLKNAPAIEENASDDLIIRDNQDNVIAVINKNGMFTKAVHSDGVNLLTQIKALQRSLEALISKYEALKTRMEALF